MYEVILTYRDFTEYAVDRYPTAEEAQSVAQRVAVQLHEQVLRAWVREIREARNRS